MKLGYARESNLDEPGYMEFQRTRLRDAGCKDANIYMERRTGAAGHRPAMNALLADIQEGDEVIVWKLDRILRNANDLLVTIEEFQNRGVSLRTLGEDFQNIDTHPSSNTQHHELFLTLIGATKSIAQESAKHNKKRKPRVRDFPTGLALTAEQVLYALEVVRTRPMQIKELCVQLGITPPTLYKYVSPEGELRAYGQRLLDRAKDKELTAAE